MLHPSDREKLCLFFRAEIAASNCPLPSIVHGSKFQRFVEGNIRYNGNVSDLGWACISELQDEGRVGGDVGECDVVVGCGGWS